MKIVQVCTECCNNTFGTTKLYDTSFLPGQGNLVSSITCMQSAPKEVACGGGVDAASLAARADLRTAMATLAAIATARCAPRRNCMAEVTFPDLRYGAENHEIPNTWVIRVENCYP